MTPAQADERKAVEAVVAFASGGVADYEGLYLAEEHGVVVSQLNAYRSLARSRGLDLWQVVVAAYRHELPQVVALPARVVSRR